MDDRPPPPPFAGIATFGRSPQRSMPDDADVAILGVPYDSATSHRAGCRFGPRAIREASLMLWGYHPVLQTAPFSELRVIDAGDVSVVPVDIQATYRAIEAVTEPFAAAAVPVITLGGDHSITLPLLRSLARAHGPVAVLHCDAHIDTWDCEYPGQRYSHGTPFIRALEERLIDPTAYIQLGIRGPTSGPQDYDNARALGARMITYEEFRLRSIPEVLTEIHTRLHGRPVYVSFDIDCVDPAFAPGTGTPEVGGLTSAEALQILRGLQGLTLIGGDVVEVSPPYDPAGITAILAANLAFDLLSLLAVQRRSMG
jgi:agmatinase/guanidinopropionase